MIISASRRTDIPNYYSNWFYNRIKDKFVLVRNPMNPHSVSKISIAPDIVDCIVFWTKNPAPMLMRLHEIKDYPYYFQFTITSYGKDIEPNVPSKKSEVIETFQKLSDTIGADRVIWRYDPILMSSKYDLEYHIHYFEKLAQKLHGYTKKCTISFLDLYQKIRKAAKELSLYELDADSMHTIASSLAEIASSFSIEMDTCAESTDFSSLGISHAKCIDNKLIERIAGHKLNVKKDQNQRAACKCVTSIDIGAYNTCLNGCRYCYANHSQELVKRNYNLHDPLSPLLFGSIADEDFITERKMISYKDPQLIFDL